MKRILLAVAIVVVSFSYSTAVLSEENTTVQPNDYGQLNSNEINSQKDECLIVVKNCTIGDETIMQRVDRLEREIGRGTFVYTPEELNYLQQQLDWIKSDNADYSVGS